MKHVLFLEHSRYRQNSTRTILHFIFDFKQSDQIKFFEKRNQIWYQTFRFGKFHGKRFQSHFDAFSGKRAQNIFRKFFVFSGRSSDTNY